MLQSIKKKNEHYSQAYKNTLQKKLSQDLFIQDKNLESLAHEESILSKLFSFFQLPQKSYLYVVMAIIMILGIILSGQKFFFDKSSSKVVIISPQVEEPTPKLEQKFDQEEQDETNNIIDEDLIVPSLKIDEPINIEPTSTQNLEPNPTVKIEKIAETPKRTIRSQNLNLLSQERGMILTVIDTSSIQSFKDSSSLNIQKDLALKNDLKSILKKLDLNLVKQAYALENSEQTVIIFYISKDKKAINAYALSLDFSFEVLRVADEEVIDDIKYITNNKSLVYITSQAQELIGSRGENSLSIFSFQNKNTTTPLVGSKINYLNVSQDGNLIVYGAGNDYTNDETGLDSIQNFVYDLQTTNLLMRYLNQKITDLKWHPISNELYAHHEVGTAPYFETEIVKFNYLDKTYETVIAASEEIFIRDFIFSPDNADLLYITYESPTDPIYESEKQCEINTACTVAWQEIKFGVYSISENRLIKSYPDISSVEQFLLSADEKKVVLKATAWNDEHTARYAHYYFVDLETNSVTKLNHQAYLASRSDILGWNGSNDYVIISNHELRSDENGSSYFQQAVREIDIKANQESLLYYLDVGALVGQRFNIHY